MDKKQLTPEQIALIKLPLPAEAIKQHPTKTFLSTIKAIYEVERLNDVFGIGSWHLRSQVIDDKTDMIVVKAILSIPEYGIELESYGGNDNGGENSKNHDLGDAYKGAVTDAFTKICSYLGIGMDVYKGKGNKPQQSAPQPVQRTAAMPVMVDDYPKDTDRKHLFALLEQTNFNDNIKELYKTRIVNCKTWDSFNNLKDGFEANKKHISQIPNPSSRDTNSHLKTVQS